MISRLNSGNTLVHSPSSQSKIQNPKSKIIWPAIILIILIAFFFRFYRLADHPLGIFFDPAINGLDAVRLMQRGGHPIFFPANGGREPLFVYLLIPSIWLFNTTPFAIRAVTATLSLLSVPLLFAFLYRVTPQYLHYRQERRGEESKMVPPPPQPAAHFWLAALGSLALAVSYWAIVTGRLGLRTEPAIFLSIPTFWFFLKGWSNGQKRWFILSGLLMGLIGYTYSSARLLPVVLALALLPEFLPPLVNLRFTIYDLRLLHLPKIANRKSKIQNRIIRLLIFTLAAAIVYLPMMWYLYTHPAQFTARAFSVMVWNFLDTPADIAAEMGRNALRVAGFFCCAGSPNPLFGLPEYPGSHPAVAPFLLIGLVGALKNWRLLFPRLVVLWWFIGLVPSIITIEAPHPLRMAMAIVPTAILIALGPIYLTQWLKTKRPNITSNRLLLLAIPVILLPIFNNSAAYFSRWTNLQSTRGAFDYGAIAIRDAVLAYADEGAPIYLPLSRLNDSTLLFYLSGSFRRQAALTAPAAETSLVISPGKNIRDTVWVRLHNHTATILPPLTGQGQQLVQAALTGNTTPIRTAEGEPVALLARQAADPVGFVEQPKHSLEASFGPVDLIGANYPMVIDPLNDLPVTLFWQANAQMGNEYDVLLRLVDDNRRVWGNGDGRPTNWVYPTTFWRPDLDKVAAQHTITLGPELPQPGRYWLALSIFDPPLNRRIALTANPDDSPDTLFIGPLKAPLPAITPAEAKQITPVQPITMGEVAQLAGFAVDKPTIEPGESIQLSLLWQALTTPEVDYTVFIHLLDSNNNLVAGHDTQPVGGRYPTTIWTPDERILDKHTLSTPGNLPAGQYRLAIGLYHQPTGQRLPLHFPNGRADSEGRLVLDQKILVQ